MDTELFLALIEKGGELDKMLQEIWNIFKIAVPVIVIVLSTVDFMLAITKEADKMKDASKKLIKRLVFSLLLFLLPVILNLLFSWTDIGGTGL